MRREEEGRKRPRMDRNKGKSRGVGEEQAKRRGKIQEKERRERQTVKGEER